MVSAPWYLLWCRLRHCVDEDDDELCCPWRRDDVVSCSLILTDSLDRRYCVMSASWYLRECRLRHCVDEDDDELRVRSKRFQWTKDGYNWRSDVLCFLYSWVHLQLPQRLGSLPAYEGGQWGTFEWTLLGDSMLIGPYDWETQLERFMQSRLCVQRVITCPMTVVTECVMSMLNVESLLTDDNNYRWINNYWIRYID